MQKIAITTIVFYNEDKKILFQDRRDRSKYGEEWGFFGGLLKKEKKWKKH